MCATRIVSKGKMKNVDDIVKERKASRTGKVAVNIHSVVQNPDYFYMIGSFSIKDQMSPYMVFAVACADVIASFSYLRLTGYHLETLVQF